MYASGVRRSPWLLVLVVLLAAACSSGPGTSGTGGHGTTSSSTSGTGGEIATGCTIDGQQVALGSSDPADACHMCRPSISSTAWSQAPDGTTCGAGKICADGACTAGCFVSGTLQAPGTADPDNPCAACEPATDTQSDVPVADGTSCGAGKVCASGSCAAACFIDAAVVKKGAVDPSDPCKTCQPAVDVTAYSEAPEGTGCAPGEICAAGSCTSSCFIDGAVVAPGTVDPANPCRACAPAASTTAYTSIAAGTPCGTGQICSNGACAAGCFIGSAVRAAGAVNPTDACQVCAPATSTTAWSQAPDGKPCGNGLICAGGVCQGECFIGGQVYASGALDPADPCHICSPGMSTTAWTPAADGTSCGSGQVCSAGACQASCFINNVVVPAGTPDPASPCKSCQPAISTTSYQPSPEGANCGSGMVCKAGACGAGCYIDGVFYNQNAQSPFDPCMKCSPSDSTSAWSPVDELVKCAPGHLCHDHACVPGCHYGGSFYAEDAISPFNPCYGCQPAVTTFGFTALNGTTCGAGQACQAGTCKPGCGIGGAFYAPNAGDPAKLCDRCTPAVSTSAWTPAADGFFCANKSVCISVACVQGCNIGGTPYPANTPQPGNPCKGCVTSVSLTAWSDFPEGWLCGSGQICAAGACQSGCLINGTFYPAGPNPAGGSFQDGTPYCQTCDPLHQTTYWSPANQGHQCNAPHVDFAVCSGTLCCGVSGAACQDLWDEFCCSGYCKFNGSFYACQ